MTQGFRTLVVRMRRAARMPPSVIGRRLLQVARSRVDPVLAPRRAQAFGDDALLRALQETSFDALWNRLSERKYPFVDEPAEARRASTLDVGDRERVVALAEAALAHRVDLLGSGPVHLGARIDWHRDPKTGRSWPLTYGPAIEYTNLDEPSDVKLPWEISRMQWLLPAGQAYLLTQDERYAAGVRDVIADWIEANPCGMGVNWGIAMEPALRILSWTWLFRACRGSKAFDDPDFRRTFLRSLYLHGRFVSRHLEVSDVNGNHCTADAAGLVFAGLFFGSGSEPRRWADAGWRLLRDELPRQVTEDGVDFEASTAYHRLVAELFLLPALYRIAFGLDVGSGYRARLAAMGRFTAAYLGPDGIAPLWGDADDGRALPLGGQPVGDHRYLPPLIGVGLDEAGSRIDLGGPHSELTWLLGPDATHGLRTADAVARTAAFPQGGVYVLAGDGDHVFIDCGPVGLAGRGGHGHNDCLGFEAFLCGSRLVSDAGSYVYTASPELRNRFRSTASHNTPMVDCAEQNRIPESLWQLTNDAEPAGAVLEEDGATIVFRGSHTGYLRLPDPVRPVRTIALERNLHALLVDDAVEALGSHEVEIPLLLAPGVEASIDGDEATLKTGGRSFRVAWTGSEGWTVVAEQGWVSPSYGIRVETTRLLWRRTGPAARLTVTISPADASRQAVCEWTEEILSTSQRVA